MIVSSLTTLSHAGYRLRVDFIWRVDRYAQQVVLVDETVSGKRDLPIMTSVEGNSDQNWPASPPLQDLNFHEPPTGQRAALAVGMAGKSHWSLAWESTVDPVGLVCDVACRIKESPGILASTWELADGVSMGPTGQLRIRAVEIGLRVDTESDAKSVTNSEHVDGQLCLTPQSLETALPRTVRWRYRISIVDDRNSGSFEK